MGLSNYQLVLLDNLIYLDTVANSKIRDVKSLIYTLLYADGNPSNGVGTGTIQSDCFNANSGKENCMMKIEDWIKVLQAIEADETLCNLRIHSVEDAGKNGFRAATFVSDETNENVFTNQFIF